MKAITLGNQVKWTNGWVEDAQNPSVKRILLIGDSVTRQYRSCLNQFVQKKGYTVDFFGASYGIFEERSQKELVNFLEQSKYSYEIIIYSDIHHGFEIRVLEEKNRLCYKDKLEHIISILNCYSHNIYLSTITPVPDKWVDLDLRDYNDEIEARNNILRSLNIFQDKSIDLWQEVKKNTVRYTDRVHFKHEYDRYFAAIIYKKLFDEVDEFLLTVPLVIDNIERLENILCTYNDIYIFGYGKRGKLLQKYILQVNGKLIKCVVSDIFYKLLSIEDKKVVCHLDKLTENTFVIVTAEDSSVPRQLFEKGISYCMVEANVYIDILYMLCQ